MWRWAAARAVGTSHVGSGTPCQDAQGVAQVDSPAGAVLVAVVSDGAGSARRSREGSRTVVRGTLAAAGHWFARHPEPPDAAEIGRWLATLRGAWRADADAAGDALRDFAATAVALFATPTATLIAHVGDGACVVADDGGGWTVGSWPENGEHANETFFLTDADGPRLRVTRLDRPVTAAALFSDGIEDLALLRRDRRAHPGFFDPMVGPVRAGTTPGRDRDLSRALRAFLLSDRVNDRTDDDKTLVLAARLP